MIGSGTDFQIGAAEKLVNVPHHAPGHWCCTTTDINNRGLVYYDSYYNGPYRTGALNALGVSIDQGSCGQGVEVEGGSTNRHGHFREHCSRITWAARSWSR